MINNKSTKLNNVKSVNIEQYDGLSSSIKNAMMKKTQSNNKNAKSIKPKIIIKIPLPFALGYITIDLSSLLSGLLSGLSGAATALVLSKLTDELSNKLSNKLNNGNVSQTDIQSSLSTINIDNIINEAILEEQNQLNNDAISISNTESLSGNENLIPTSGETIDTSKSQPISIDIDIDDTKKDIYVKSNNITKRNINKSQYTLDKRNRTDVLDSQTVKNRNTSKTNKKYINNPNYGKYLD